MKKYYPYLLSFLFLFFGLPAVQAQFNTPVINGTIGAGEYGNHVNGQNQETNGATVTYITWDAAALYVGVSAANTAEGFVMYMDADNLTPINGGSNANGSFTGTSYDNTNFVQLPFRADLVMYVKSGYREYRTANGSGGWSAANTAFGSYAESAGSVREFSIPWSAFPGGVKPAAFNWFSYVTSGGGFVYAQLPAANAGGFIGTSARYDRYFNLTNTSNGASTLPMSRNCYVFNAAADVLNFGTIAVYDFTMNTAGRFISRTGATGQNWSIGGNLVCAGGTIYFGSGGTNGAYGSTTVGGNLDIRGGTVDLDQTTSALDLTGDLLLSSGTLKLSSNNFGGGDLKLKGNWSNTGGTFTPSGRAVFFNSATAGQAVSKAGQEVFDIVIVDKGSTSVSLSTNMQVNNNLTLTSGSLSINSQTLTVNGTVSGTGTISGTSSSGLILGGTGSSLNFTPASRSLNNLTMNNGSGATLNSALDIYGTVSLTTASLNLAAQNLTLKSNATNTARIADLSGSTLTGATNVTMERYIKLRAGGDGRAYRLLSPTVNTTGSIQANWMEGGMNTAVGTNVNPVPLFGTQITGAGGNTNGFDKTQSNASSLYLTTNALVPTYTAVTSTTGTLNALTGYFMYVRGDRSMDMTLPLAPNMPTSNTTLRTTGSLLTGTQTSFTNAFTGGGAWNLVTNPYPSPIDWSLVQPACTNITGSYIYWDPNIGTRGGFAAVTTGGVSTPATSATQFIQSGQAFFVESDGGVPAVSIQEGHKAAGNNNNVFLVPPPPVESFRTELYFTEPNGYRRIADGAIALYDNAYSAAVDAKDTKEIGNWDENIAIAREGKKLAIEARPVIGKSDDLPIYINNMKQQAYEFEFTPLVFTNTRLKAELIDNFLNTRTLLSVTDPTVVAFTVTADPASKATDRFKVVFGEFGNPQGVDAITIKASQQNGGVQVDWTSKTETDMLRYEVEKSTYGTTFAKVNNTAAIGNSNAPVDYNWFDTNPHMGTNFYRIKGIDKAGNARYSEAVRVLFGKGEPSIVVYPNPVQENTFKIDMYNLVKGTYVLNLYNSMGQLVYTEQLQHDGSQATKTINLKGEIGKGALQLQLAGANGFKTTQRIIKN